jgi:hypothetical protein
LKQLFTILICSALAGCGGAAIPDDHITKITEKIQPVVDDWRLICKAGRGCMESAGQDPGELVEACERGWAIFQAIEAYQSAYCTIRGIQCSRD